MMIRLLVFGMLLQVLGGNSQADDTFTCTAGGEGSFPKPSCYDPVCTSAIVSHIQHEFDAAFKYMYMGAKFGQYTTARPGITKFLLESASEERSHAIQMLDYLNTRGITYTKPYNFSQRSVWRIANDGVTIENALKEAIEMEIDVTNRIKEVVKTCGNDFHAADVFTNPILDEQHNGLRKLQGALRTLQVMKATPINAAGRAMAEYFFDLKLLSGEV